MRDSLLYSRLERGCSLNVTLTFHKVVWRRVQDVSDASLQIYF